MKKVIDKESDSKLKLLNSKTFQNLKDGFALESQANRIYLFFAQRAVEEGFNDIADIFKETAEGEGGHAFGHFEFMEPIADPLTGKSLGDTETNLKTAIEGETYEYTELYPGFARIARDEEFFEIAEWFETLARAEKSHAGRLQRALVLLKKGKD
ncbi:MAG: rubrerythrin family protein [Bacteroidetes bacterium]|nr:rubrerythrin family protein [Bacteroidota bacterium]